MSKEIQTAKVQFTKDHSYSIDKVNVTNSKKGDIVEVSAGLASRMMHKGVCVQILNEDKKRNNFNPVEETAVIDPVEEVKEKPKRKKRGKKAE